MVVNFKMYRVEIDEEEYGTVIPETGDSYSRDREQQEPGHGGETHPRMWEGEGGMSVSRV